MADGEPRMTRKEMVVHAAITLVVPVAVAWAAVALAARPEAARQYAGGVLELLGFLTVAYGLEEKLAQVTARPGLRERVAEWIRRAWRRLKMAFGWKPPRQTIAAPVAEVTAEAGDVRVKKTPPSDASLDQRVEILEQEVEKLRSRIDDVEKEARDARAELQAEIDDVRGDLREVEEELEALIRRLAIGSLHWEATGLFWFVLGVVSTTWPGVIPGA